MTRIDNRPVVQAAMPQVARVKGKPVPRDPAGPEGPGRGARGYAGPAVDGGVTGQRGRAGARTGAGAVVTPRAMVVPVKDVVVTAKSAPIATLAPSAICVRLVPMPESPFAQLATQGSGYALTNIPIEPLATAQPLEQPVSLPPEVLAKLGDVDVAALGLGGEQVVTATSKVRKGMLLSGAEMPADPALDAESVATLASLLQGGMPDVVERRLAATLPGCLARMPIGVDVNALVQAVLRESYLLQCESLLDFADKVKFYNELKKRIRAELQRARQTLAGASALADDAELGFEYLPGPVDAVDASTGGPAGDGASDQGGSPMPPAGGDKRYEGAFATPAILGPPPPVEVAPAPTIGALPAFATAWTGQSADEIINTLRDDPAASFAVPYGGKYIVLSGSPVAAVYGEPPRQLTVSIADAGEGTLLQLAGLPDMKVGKGSIYIDSSGALMRTSSPPIPDHATLWTEQGADEVRNQLESGRVAAYAIPYGNDFIMVRKNPQAPPALSASFGGSELQLSIVTSAAGGQVQIAGLPDMRRGKDCLVLDVGGALRRSAAALLPDGAWLWNGEPSDVVLSKLSSGVVAVPYEGGYVVLSAPLAASFPSDPSLTPTVTVAETETGKLLQISGLPKMAVTNAALTIDARGAIRTARGPLQPEGSLLWAHQGASALNKLLVEEKRVVAILYDGKYIELSSSDTGEIIARIAGTELTAKFEQREGQTVLSIRGLPGTNPKTDALHIDERGVGKLFKGPTEIENGYGRSASELTAWLEEHPGKPMGIPYGDHFLELRLEDGKLAAAYLGTDVSVSVADDRLTFTRLPDLKAAERVVAGKDGTYLERGTIVSRRRTRQHDEAHPEWANSHTIKATTLGLTTELISGLSDGQQQALLAYFAGHALTLSGSYTLKGGATGQYVHQCAPPHGQTLEEYLADAAEEARAALPGNQADDYHVKWLTVEIPDWPDVSRDYFRKELAGAIDLTPVIEDDPALERGRPVLEEYHAPGTLSDEVDVKTRDDGESVGEDGDGAGTTTGDDPSDTGGGPGPTPTPPPVYHEWKPGDPIVTKADLDAYAKSLEEKLNTAGDDAQLANVDLQNALQVQQQTIQMMSNISKVVHDTALAIIRKIGG